MVVYCSPAELKKVVDESIATYNRTPHTSLDNVSPNDVYAGRKEEILQQRKEKKRLTLERRKQYKFNPNNQSPDRGTEFCGAAEEKNTENLLMIRDKRLSALYAKNWEGHKSLSAILFF